MLLKLRLWRDFPMTMLLAVICWLLPVASVITPATLKVKLAPVSNSTLMRVPRVDFHNLNFFSTDTMLIGSQSHEAVQYRSSKPLVKKVASATAAQGKVMAIAPPSVNSSWSLDLHSPILRCGQVDQSLDEAIRQNIEDCVRSMSLSDTGSEGTNVRLLSYGYIAWAPGDSSTNGSLPFVKEGSTYKQREGLLGPLPISPAISGLYLCLFLWQHFLK
jgi:hypothetical protein